jgi:hypothetical protein
MSLEINLSNMNIEIINQFMIILRKDLLRLWTKIYQQKMMMHYKRRLIMTF